MRDSPASIGTMLSVRTSTTLTLARCVKLVLRDGYEVGFTDHDQPLTVPLSNDSYQPLEYQAADSIEVGDLDLAIGLSADNTEITAPLSALITQTRLLARRFHMADVYIFDVDWTQETPQPLELMAGYITDATPAQGRVRFQVRSQADRWNTVIGRLASPRCSADFGDIKCGVTPTEYPCEIFESTSNMRFTVGGMAGGPYSDDFFRFGTVEFLTGPLADTWPFEIVSYDGYEGEIELLSPMPGFAQVGDQLVVRNGCSKLKRFPDDPTVPTCATYSNQRRFRGFDQMPGSDRFLRFPIPGQSDE